MEIAPLFVLILACFHAHLAKTIINGLRRDFEIIVICGWIIFMKIPTFTPFLV